MTSCTDSWVRLDQILSAHPVDATTWILDRIYRADWDREGTDMENPGNLCEIARSFGDASARSKEKLLLHLLDGFGQLPVECREKIVVTLVPAIVALYLALTKVKETSPLILAWVELFSHTNFNELDIAILQKLARALERELRKLPMAVFVYALGCMSSSERKALLLSLRGAKPIDVPQRVLLCQILESKYCHKYARQLVLMLKQFSFSALATFAVLLFFEFYLASRFTGCGETLAAWLMMDAFLWFVTAFGLAVLMIEATRTFAVDTGSFLSLHNGDCLRGQPWYRCIFSFAPPLCSVTIGTVVIAVAIGEVVAMAMYIDSCFKISSCSGAALWSWFFVLFRFVALAFAYSARFDIAHLLSETAKLLLEANTIGVDGVVCDTSETTETALSTSSKESTTDSASKLDFTLEDAACQLSNSVDQLDVEIPCKYDEVAKGTQGGVCDVEPVSVVEQLGTAPPCLGSLINPVRKPKAKQKVTRGSKKVSKTSSDEYPKPSVEANDTHHQVPAVVGAGLVGLELQAERVDDDGDGLESDGESDRECQERELSDRKDSLDQCATLAFGGSTNDLSVALGKVLDKVVTESSARSCDLPSSVLLPSSQEATKVELSESGSAGSSLEAEDEESSEGVVVSRHDTIPPLSVDHSKIEPAPSSHGKGTKTRAKAMTHSVSFRNRTSIEYYTPLRTSGWGEPVARQEVDTAEVAPTSSDLSWELDDAPKTNVVDKTKENCGDLCVPPEDGHAMTLIGQTAANHGVSLSGQTKDALGSTLSDQRDESHGNKLTPGPKRMVKRVSSKNVSTKQDHQESRHPRDESDIEPMESAPKHLARDEVEKCSQKGIAKGKRLEVSQELVEPGKYRPMTSLEAKVAKVVELKNIPEQKKIDRISVSSDGCSDESDSDDSGSVCDIDTLRAEHPWTGPFATPDVSNFVGPNADTGDKLVRNGPSLPRLNLQGISESDRELSRERRDSQLSQVSEMLRWSGTFPIPDSIVIKDAAAMSGAERECVDDETAWRQALEFEAPMTRSESAKARVHRQRHLRLGEHSDFNSDME